MKQCGDTVACTITAHHLALTVDDWAGKPLNFCKPVAKFPSDRKALRDVIKEGECFSLLSWSREAPTHALQYTRARIHAGHPRFFLGSDSAPHPFSAKMPSAVSHGSTAVAAQHSCAAGVYTSAVLLPLCATLLESFGALDKLEGYVSSNGRKFYGDEVKGGKSVTLRRVQGKEEGVVPAEYVHKAHVSKADTEKGKISVIPFMAGQQLGWVIA